MTKAPIHEEPIKDGGKSVLSDKNAIKGLPKSKEAKLGERNNDNCASPLEDKDCIEGQSRGRSPKKPAL